MTETTKKWNEEVTAKLMTLIGQVRPVPGAVVESASAELGFTPRSVAAKLRQLDVEVASMAKEKVIKFSPEQTEALANFVKTNAGLFTYKEISERFPGGFSPKEVQGKILALELTAMVKPAEKVEAARTYTEAQEAEFVQMANAGAFIEEIAAAMGKEVASARGKALSLFRSGLIAKIPSQKESHAKNVVDAFEALGDAVTNMTVAAIASALDRTERGVRTLLTRRGVKVADYDGAQKRAKAEAKAAEAKA